MRPNFLAWPAPGLVRQGNIYVVSSALSQGMMLAAWLCLPWYLTVGELGQFALITFGSELLTRLARCCSPVPGDRIVGFVTRGSGVTVHRADCSNVTHLTENERLVAVGKSERPLGHDDPRTERANKRGAKVPRHKNVMTGDGHAATRAHEPLHSPRRCEEYDCERE